MRRFGIIALAAVLTGLVLGIVVASSGDSGSATPSVPELKPPPGKIEGESGTTDEKTTSTDTTTSAPVQTQTAPSEPSGGAQTPPNDTEQNDVPPPQGSPADRFEQFCKDNPGAC